MWRLLALIFLMSSLASGGEKTVMKDNENYIAIGYSENSSEQLAKQDACNAARRELIGYVFGTAYQINQTMVRSLGVLDYAQDVSSASGEIVIRGAVTETDSHRGTTKCTISYPIQEASLEKERIKSAINFKNTLFTDVGDARQIKGGVLEIVTIPDDADVFIDNQRWGTTPLRLNGKLSVGEHKVRIERDNYKTIEVSETIGTGGKRRIEQILKRATGKLRVVTEVPGATIFIDGQNVGESPTDFLELLAGHKAKIEVRHPEAETIIQSIAVTRDEERTLNIPLQLKPSFFSIHIAPDGATILLDNRLSVAADKWVQAAAGSHRLLVSSEGYEDAVVEFELRGGEKKSLSSLILRSISKAKERHLKNGALWSVGAYLGISQSTFRDVDPLLNQLGLQVRYQLFRYFSIELIGTYDSGKATYADAELTASGYSLNIGVPVRLSQWESGGIFNKRISLSPEAVWSSHSYLVTYKSGESGSINHTHSGFGGSLILSLSRKTDYNEAGYFFDFRLGVIQSQDSSPLMGAMPLSLGLTGGWQW